MDQVDISTFTRKLFDRRLAHWAVPTRLHETTGLVRVLTEAKSGSETLSSTSSRLSQHVERAQKQHVYLHARLPSVRRIPKAPTTKLPSHAAELPRRAQESMVIHARRKKSMKSGKTARTARSCSRRVPPKKLTAAALRERARVPSARAVYRQDCRSTTLERRAAALRRRLGTRTHPIRSMRK